MSTATIQEQFDKFQSSRSSFQIVQSHKLDEKSSPQTLFILDSSFNPPTLAHLNLLLSSLESTNYEKYPLPVHILLLLSTNNADKPPAPASFPLRLSFMSAFASDLISYLHASSSGTLIPTIDVGLTTNPYYTDKSMSITLSDIYPSDIKQVHIMGFDTLTRFMGVKYYQDYKPPLSALKPYFDAGYEIRATLRPDCGNGYDTIDEQKAWIDGIENGDMDDLGVERWWRDKIAVVEPTTSNVDEDRNSEVSSTLVRKAAKDKDWKKVRSLCTPTVARVLQEIQCYNEDDGGKQMN